MTRKRLEKTLLQTSRFIFNSYYFNIIYSGFYFLWICLCPLVVFCRQLILIAPSKYNNWRLRGNVTNLNEYKLKQKIHDHFAAALERLFACFFFTLLLFLVKSLKFWCLKWWLKRYFDIEQLIMKSVVKIKKKWMEVWLVIIHILLRLLGVLIKSVLSFIKKKKRSIKNCVNGS